MKTWAEVAESPEFGKLSATEQAAAREQYFRDAVAPQVPREELAAVRRQFDADPDTRIRKQPLNPKVRPSTEGAGRGRQGGPDPDTMPPMDRFRLSLADARTPIQPRDQSERRGGVRREIEPFVAGGGDAGAGRGLVNPPTVGSEAPDYTARGPAGALADVRANTAARNERLAPPPTAGQLLEQPAPADQRVPGLSDVEMAQGSIAPDRLAAMQAQADYLSTRRSPSARPLNTAQDLTARLRDATSNPVVRGAVSGFAQLGQVGVGAVRAGAEAVGADGLAERARGASAAASTVAQDSTRDLRGNDKLIADVTSSIINSAPAVAMGVVGGPAMRTLFAQSAAADYAETGNAAHAGIQAAAEVLGERFGFSEQVKLLKGVVRGMPTNEVAKVFGALITKEIPGEQLTTALQFLGDKIGPGARNPNATMADYLQQAGDTLAVTIGQTAVMGGGPAALSTTRNALARGDQAIDRSARTMAERAAMDAGFAPAAPKTAEAPPALQPTEVQRDMLARFDNFAAVNGLTGKVAAAVKKAASEVPLAEAAGFMKRAVQALAKRGLYQGPVDDAALTMLDQPATPAAQAAAAQPTPEQPPAAAPAPLDAEADFTGLDTPAAAPAPVAGEPINRNWTAYSPESGTLGIPRADMPQIKAEHRGALVQFMKGRGISHQAEEVDPTTLKPTQAEFSPKKVQGAREFTGGDRAVLVSADGYVLDGHHQWQAKLDDGLPVKVLRLNAPIQDLLRLAHQFPSSTTAGGPRRTNDVAQPDVAAPAPVASAPGDGASDQPGGSSGDLRPDAGANDRVAEPAPAPAPSGRAAAPVGNAGQPDAALKSRVIGSYGKTPKGATEIELRANADGTLTPYTGKYPMLDFNSGEPIVVASDATDAGAIEQIRAAGAIGKKDKVFGVKKDEPAAPAASPAPSAAAPAESPGDALRSVVPNTKQPEAAAPTSSNPQQPRRGKVGDKLASGEVVLTSSGRTTTPFPSIKIDTDRKAGSTLRAVDRWLLENAAAEARARGDNFNARTFEADAKMTGIPQASKDSAEEYLFGEQPPVIPSILQPITTRDQEAAPAAAPAAAEPAADVPGAGPAGVETPGLIEHVTKKGKTIRGVVRKDMTGAEAMAIDVATFKKDGGYFIREKHLAKLAEFDAKRAPAAPAATPAPAPAPVSSMAPGTRINGARERAAADRLEKLLETFMASRNTPEGAGRGAIRGVIDELRKPTTVTSIEAVLETASSRLMRQYPAQAKVVDEVIESLSAPTIADQARTLRERALEARRLERETERAVFRDLLANPEIVGMSLKNIEVLVSAKAGTAIKPEKAALLARAIHKEAAKRAADLEKAKHRDPAVRAAALGEAVTAAFPDAADATPDRHAALAAGWDHALKGKTKSTLAGDNLADRLTGYEAAQRWIKTEEGAAWYEGRPVNKLQNTGVDLRRWYDQLKAQMKADEPDISKAWKQIERATARSDLFAPLLPEGVTPGYRTYIVELRDMVQPFKAWLENAYSWNGEEFSRSRYSGSSKSNTELMLEGRRYPSAYSYRRKVSEQEADAFENDEAFRANWLRERAAEYVQEVQNLLGVVEGTSSVQEAATNWHDRFVKTYSDRRWNVSADNLTDQGKLLVTAGTREAKGLADLWKGGEVAAVLQFSHESAWSKNLIANESTIALPDKATPLTPPRLDRVTRDGPNLRNGNNVTPKDFEDMFGMASVGFGKWVAAKQDQDHLNYAYDAFADLAKHFGAPINAIGFGQQLHFTVGALGHGKFAAHFHPAQPSPIGPVPVINLTNTKGDGTVYHEWVHALDHFLGGQWRDGMVRERVLSYLKNGVLTPERVEKVAERFLVGGSYWQRNKKWSKVEAAVYAMSRSDVLFNATAYKTNADALGKDYWGNDEELLARAGEAWAADTLGHTNTYLVNPDWVGDGKVTQGANYRGTPYPSGAERQLFNQVLTALAKAIKWTDGRPSVTMSDFMAQLPEEFKAGEKRRLELKDKAAMEALLAKIQARRADEEAARAADAAERARREQQELDDLAEQKVKDLPKPPAPPIVDAPQPSATSGPLTDDDLSALFDEAAAELREEQQEQPNTPPPGEVDRERWTQADLDEMLAAQDQAGASGIATAIKLPGFPTIHELGALGKTAHLGFGMFETTGRAPGKDARTLGEDWRLTWDGGGAMRQTKSGKSYTLVQVTGPRPFTMSLKEAMAAVAPPAAAPAAPKRDPGTMTQLERDRAASGRTPAPAPAPAPAAPAADPKAAQLIAQAAALGVKGADEALTGLAKLFGGPGRLNSFPAGFDEETYQKAKPHFQAALVSFQDAGKTLKDLFKLLIQQFGDGIKEYAIRFAKDQELTAQLGSAASASSALADWVKSRLAVGHSFDWRLLFMKGDEFFGGTQAEGKYTPKDAYDAMEAGMNRYILARPDLFNPAVGREDAMRAVAALTRVTNLLPTQTKRTAEQDQFQQFSTVPPFAYLANWVANIQAGETMGEFSAGIGGLAVFAKNAGAKLVLNELSARRAAVLREVFPGARVFQENAEQIDNILPDDIVPSVVVINPPFSSSASTGAKSTMVGAQHVEQALERLAPGGRFVGIVGEGMQLDKPAFSAWWSKIRKEYHVRAVVPVDGSGYAKYGTTFNNALLVIDKIKPPKDAAKPIVTPVTDYTDLIGLLAEVRDDRPAHNVPIDERAATQPDPERGDGPAVAAGAGDPVGGSTAAGGAADVGDRQPGGRSGVGGSGGSGGRAGRGQRSGGTGGQSGRPGIGDGTGPADGRAADAGVGGRLDSTGDATGVSIAGSQTAASGELTDSVFETYTPQRLQVPGAKPHPGALVQSAAMASVLPPAPTYTPNLPKETVEGGLLSIAQIESIVYAGQAHSQMLDMTVELSGRDPEAFARANKLKPDTKYRRGFFIGDGTGVGKGREISGIMLDNLRQGRPRAVWVSEKQGLMADAKRDFAGVGGDAGIIFNQNKTAAADKIDAADGILFTTYATLRSGAKDAEAGGFKKGVPVQVGRAFGAVGRSGEGVDYDTAKLVKIDQKKSQVTVEFNGKTSVHPFGQILSINGDSSWLEAIRDTGKAAQTRLDQLVNWLGPDFDGVIAFDEAHNAGNAVPMKGERGTSDPSAQAMAVVELQRRLPGARVVYVSATGATEVSNLSFATRLGLWGPGTVFPNVDSFIAQMTAGGLATMELVARDMKQTGSYLARSLSFDGVSYSRVEHELTDLQRDIYDKLAEAWQVTLQNFMAALEATGVVSSETGKSKNGRALAAAKSAYWGAQQRFFNQIITSMQMPSVLEAIERDLAAGDAVVLQLVNTNEAQQERALAKKKKEGESEELEDLDLTPRDQLIQMVEKSFPVQQYEDKFDDQGKRITVPVLDSEGKPVLNKKAVAMRDALIKDLQQIRVPDGPLELILNQFGPDVTAEITGRKQRVVRKPNKDGEITAQLEKRGDAAVRADAEAFMADKKRILVFSDAGGTGFSFHADLTKTNQRKRKHYLIQPGWRANKAVQGLGRSHRTNQASAPHYTLASTNIPAHKRFLSSIARRLDQLGALTKGQRDTSSGGLFSEKDNLESKYATQAVRRLIDDVRLGQVEGIAFDEFLRQLGLEDIVNADTQQIAEDKYPPTRQFLNRMLSLTLAMQEKVFNGFIARMEEQVDLAAARGELDTGMQTLRALRTRVVNQQVVHVDERTGAETAYVELELEQPTKTYPFPDPAKQGGKIEWLVNVKSDRVWGRVKSGTTTKKDGTIVDRYRMLGTGGTQIRDDRDFTPGAYKSIDQAEALERWDRETAARPATYTEKAHMIVGAMLPIWDRINVGTGILEVARTQTEDGQRLLGRKVAPKDVADLLKRLDIAPSESKLDPAEVMARVLRGEVGELANGWKLKRSKVSDDLRVELTAGGRNVIGGVTARELVAAGVIQERIQWNERYFVPVDKPAVLAALMKNRPLIALSKPGDDAPALSRQDQAALDALERRLQMLGRGVPVDQLRAEVAKIAEGWDRKTVPAPLVVANAGELPEGIQAALRSMGAYNTTRGLMMPSGQAYLIADALPDMETAQMVLFHEVYGHIGLRTFLGKGYDTQMGMLRLANPALAKEADAWFASFGEDQIRFRIDKGMSQDEATRVVKMLAVEEALADRAGDNPPPKGWKLVMASLQKALRRMGMDKLANWLEAKTEAETHALLMSARAAVRGERMHAFTGDTVPAMQQVREGGTALQGAEPTDQTNTPAFRAWFKDSKVVDAEGKPLVVYHGTTADFSEFDVNQSFDGGFHFGNAEAAAKRLEYWSADGGFQDEYPPRIMPVYLSLQNPMRLQRDLITEDKWIEAIDDAKAKGHDGIVYPNKIEGGESFIAFRPEQIKSAIGNRGTFDPNSANILQNISRIGTKMAAMGYEPSKVENLQATRKLAALVKRLEAGEITESYFTLAVKGLADQMADVAQTKAANRLMKDRQRGPDLVRERLIRARRQSDMEPEAVDFALWAIDQNPSLAENLGISVIEKGGNATGDYNPAAEIIRIFKGGEKDDTAVHELMHHTERMMPGDMQAAIRREWAASLARAIKSATPEQAEILGLVGAALAGDRAAYQAIVKGIQEGPLNYEQHYQLVNPSEFWAVNAARLLQRRFDAKGSIWQRIHTYLAEMVQKVKALLGMRSDAPALKALDYLLNQDNFGPERGGRFESQAMLSDVRALMTTDGRLPAIRRDPKHTPEQAKALAKAGTGGPPSARQKLRLYWGEAVDLVRNRGALGQTFRQGALDQFYGIQRAVTRELGNLPVEQDPYVTARLANGGTSAVMRALMLHGQARWAANGQHLEKIPNTKGLLDILKPLGDDVNDWFGWMIGNRAARLMKEGRENNFTPTDIKALQSLATPEKRVKFAQAALEYKAFKRSVLDLAQAAGLIDPAGRAAWDHADYIPFYRQFDEKALFSPTGRKGLAGQSSGIRTLKGGTSALNDPMENLLMNFSRLVDASLKNNAIRKTIGALADTEVVNKVGYDMTGVSVPAKEVARYLVEQGTPEDVLGTMPPEVFEGIARMWAIKPPADPDVVRVMEGGKPKFYRVNDPLLLKALTSFVPFDFPGLALMRWAKRLLTSLVTSTPEFMLRNFIRDSVAVQAIGRQGFNPAKSVAGVAKSYRESGGFEAMLFAGASFQSGNVNAADPEATGRAMRRALRSRGLSAASTEAFIGTLIDTPAKLWEQYSKIGEAIENANREAVFEATGNAGGSVTASAFEAKDLMDFSLRGSWPAYQLLADVLPFFNARVQGLYRLGRSDPKRLAAVGGLLMVASLLLGFANDGEDWYEELPDWDKDLYWHFRIGGQHFRLPKPFEIGVIFATIPERIGRSIKGLDGGKKTLDRLWANVRDQLAFDPVPQLIRPVMDVWANKDTFRDRPIENQADEGKAPHARYNAMTSATTRVITGAAAPVTDAIGLGPKKLEYLVNGYFGTVGMYALGLSDLAVRSLEGAPPGPAWRADDIPVVRAFYRVDPARSTVFETDLYKMNQEVDRLYREMRALQKDGKAQDAAKLVSENRDKLAVRDKVNSGVQALTNLNRQRDKIINDRTMTPEQKRVALDELQRKKNAIAKTVATNPTVRAALQ